MKTKKLQFGTALAIFLFIFSNNFGQNHTSMWTSRYFCTAGSIDSAVAAILDANGNLWVAGSSKCYSSSSRDIAVMKYNAANGELMCSPFLSGLEYDDWPTSLKADNSYVYVCGQRYFLLGNKNIVVYKFNLDCSIAASVQFIRNGGDYGNDMAVDASGNIYVAGRTDTTINSVTTQRYLIVKFSPSCVELWRLIYVGAESGTFDEAQSIKTDGAGNIYVTGFTSQGQTNYDSYDYLTMKLNSGGTLEWARRFNGAGNKEDFGIKLSIDNNSNVFVTGYSYTNATTVAMTTLAYNAGGESIAFDAMSCGNGTLNYPTDMTIDNSNNVYVTGYGGQCVSASSMYDYVIVKYGSGLQRQWSRSYNGTGNGNDIAKQIAVNGTGNIYVTGTTNGNSEGKNYLTLQYGPDGSLLWTQPTHFGADDNAAGIALDPVCEKVFVTGYVHVDTNSNIDIYTAAYGCVLGITPVSNEVPEKFSLGQNYPNPFNASSKFKVQIAKSGRVNLTVFDVTGKIVDVLFDGELQPGAYEISFDGTNYPSGVYFYQLRITNYELSINYIETKKLALIK